MERLPISISLKRKIKFLQQPDIPEDLLEVAHKESVHRGGTNDPSNLMAISRVDHAFQHFQDASYSRDWATSRKDWYAVSSIRSRMTDSEKKIFDFLIANERG